MKLGLDLHGVISDNAIFGYMAKDLIFMGWEVHVITGGSKEKALDELNNMGYQWNVHYTHIFSILDYHIEKGTRITGWHPTLKNPEFPDKEWDQTKADYCREHNIGLHLDDSLIYEKEFTTPFARVWTNTNTPKLNKPIRHHD